MTMFNDLGICWLFLVELDFLVANAALCDLRVFCCGLGDQILVELVSNWADEPDNEENEFGDSKEVGELVNDVLKFGIPHCSEIQEHEEFDKILYVRASMFRHLV